VLMLLGSYCQGNIQDVINMNINININIKLKLVCLYPVVVRHGFI
jgi:hypothetical protein